MGCTLIKAKWPCRRRHVGPPPPPHAQRGGSVPSGGARRRAARAGIAGSGRAKQRGGRGKTGRRGGRGCESKAGGPAPRALRSKPSKPPSRSWDSSSGSSGRAGAGISLCGPNDGRGGRVMATRRARRARAGRGRATTQLRAAVSGSHGARRAGRTGPLECTGGWRGARGLCAHAPPPPPSRPGARRARPSSTEVKNVGACSTLARRFPLPFPHAPLRTKKHLSSAQNSTLLPPPARAAPGRARPPTDQPTQLLETAQRTHRALPGLPPLR